MKRGVRCSAAWILSAGCALGVLLAPRLGRAEPAHSVLSYGSDAFWTGAQLGLAAGYLRTGRSFESDEWRTLAFGSGVGALVGMGAGLTLWLVDLNAPPPNSGWTVLTDIGYGTSLGALAGTAVGALTLLDDGRPKNLLNGAAYGSLVGAGVGLVFGVIESAVASGRRDRSEQSSGPCAVEASLGVTVVEGHGGTTWLPALTGRF